MKKLVCLKEKDIERIGNIVADAFMSEPGPYPNHLDSFQARCYFQETIRMLSKCKCLYALDQEEGFIAWFHKNQTPGFFQKLFFSIRLLSRISVEKINPFLTNVDAWDDYEKQYKKSKDYVDIFLVAVKKSEQGKGHLKELLKEPMAEAHRYNIPCILDTDSRVKKEKYEHEGFQVVKKGILSDGTEMFTLEYR